MVPTQRRMAAGTNAKVGTTKCEEGPCTTRTTHEYYTLRARVGAKKSAESAIKRKRNAAKQKLPEESLPRLPDANDRLATVAVDQPPRPDDRVLHPALPHLRAEPSEMETNLPRNVQRRRKLLDASETGTSMNSSSLREPETCRNGRRKPPGFRGVRR